MLQVFLKKKKKKFNKHQETSASLICTTNENDKIKNPLHTPFHSFNAFPNTWTRKKMWTILTGVSSKAIIQMSWNIHHEKSKTFISKKTRIIPIFI